MSLELEEIEMTFHSILQWIIFVLVLAGLFSGCEEPLDIDKLSQICRPIDPKCADEDYDGDGVINRNDDFPSDSMCSERSRTHCSE